MTSQVWLFTRHVDGKRVSPPQCRFRNKTFSAKVTTNNIKRHLRVEHKISYPASAAQDQQMSRKKCIDLCIRLVVKSMRPFNIVEDSPSACLSRRTVPEWPYRPERRWNPQSSPSPSSAKDSLKTCSREPATTFRCPWTCGQTKNEVFYGSHMSFSDPTAKICPTHFAFWPIRHASHWENLASELWRPSKTTAFEGKIASLNSPQRS